MSIEKEALHRIVAKFVGAANSSRDVCEFGELCDAFIEEARAVLAAAPAVRPHCQCQPKECHGKGINECRWKIMGYSPDAQPQEPPRSAPLTEAKEAPGGVNVPGYGYVDLRAVRAIEAAHGISTPEEKDT